MITGAGVSLFAAVFPVGMLADISNSGTLFAFFMVALAVHGAAPQPTRPATVRSARRWCGSSRPLAVIGCIVLFLYLPRDAKLVFPLWAVDRPVLLLHLRLSQEPHEAGQRAGG